MEKVGENKQGDEPSNKYGKSLCTSGIKTRENGRDLKEMGKVIVNKASPEMYKANLTVNLGRLLQKSFFSTEDRPAQGVKKCKYTKCDPCKYRKLG